MPEDRTDAPEGDGPDEGGRARTVLFVVVFVSAVLSMLAAYRCAVDTRANDRYLYHVARDTAWLLRKIGVSAELEAPWRTKRDPKEVRAQLEAWAQGKEHPDAEAVARQPDGPLTAWELWGHRAQATRRQSTASRAAGPHVTFVLKEGLSSQIRDLAEEHSRLRALQRRGVNTHDTRIKQLEEAQSELRKQLGDTDLESAEGWGARGFMFAFSVVSECGAIEVMAIFLAAVIAFPTRFWKKLIALLVGLPIMYGVNVLRLTILGVIGALYGNGSVFDFAHHYVWQAVYIIFVVAVWLAWIELLVRREWTESWVWARGLAARPGVRSVLLFCGKFLVLVVVLTLLWWWAVPLYGYVLMHICGGILRYAAGVPIESGYIEAAGLFNTETRLVWVIGESRPAMPLAMLVTNVPPYLALVLATAGIALWRRVRILAYGVSILLTGHVAFIVVMLRFQEALQQASDVPQTVIQFYVALPFLLWIVFALFLGRAPKRRKEMAPITVPESVPEDGEEQAPGGPGAAEE